MYWETVLARLPGAVSKSLTGIVGSALDPQGLGELLFGEMETSVRAYR